MARVVPTCLALVLCEAVTRSAATNDPTIHRAFDTFDVPSFPAKTGGFSVWMQLTGGHGATATMLVVEHIPPDSIDAELVVPIEFSLNFVNPNEVLEHDSALEDGIELEKVGRYRLRLQADGVTVMQRYFVARQAS